MYPPAARHCPVIEVSLAAPAQWATMGHGTQLGLPLPSCLVGPAIIDTGAERSVVRADICDALCLPRTVPVALRGVTAPGMAAVGAATRTMLRRAVVDIAGRSFTLDVISAELADDAAVMLVGMDILSHGRLMLDGPRGVASLLFGEPMAALRRPPARAGALPMAAPAARRRAGASR